MKRAPEPTDMQKCGQAAKVRASGYHVQQSLARARSLPSEPGQVPSL